MTVSLLDSPIVGATADASAAAEALVRNYCHWHIAPTVEETITFEPTWRRTLVLPSLSVQEVTTVVEDGVEVPSDDFTVSRWGLWRLNGFWSRAVTVTFTHGFDSCPADVAAVVAGLAKGGITTGGGGRSVRVGQVSVSSPSGALDSSGRSVLDAYRLVG